MGRFATELRRAAEGYSERDLAILTEFIGRLRSVVANTAEGIRNRLEMKA